MQIGQVAVARSNGAASRTGAVGNAASIWSPTAPTDDGAGSVAGRTGGSWSELLSRLSNRTAGVGNQAKGQDDQALVREWTRDLSASDRKLVEKLSGKTLSADGRFLDQDGNESSVSPSVGAVVAALSLARTQDGEGAAIDDPIAADQFDGLCQRVQVALFQAGEQFDASVRGTGQDFLKQQADAAAEDDDPLLPIAKQHYVQDLVADPTFAMSQMEQYCHGTMAIMMKLPVPPDGKEGYVDPELVHAAFERYFSFQSQVQAVHDHAKELLEKGKAEGKTGAEIYADVLRDQLSQPDSYWHARDPDNLWGQGKEKVQAELNALEKAIAAKAA